MRSLRSFLRCIVVAAILPLMPVLSPPVWAAAGTAPVLSPEDIPNLTPAQAMVLQDAVRKGELTPEVREILRDHPELAKRLPSNLQEALESETAGERGLDNAALRKPDAEAGEPGKGISEAGKKERLEAKPVRLPYDWKKSVYVSRLFLSRLQKAEREHLVHFGHDLFDPRQEAAPVGETVPVPDNYVVGRGDEIVVRLWGRMEGSHRLRVDRDGKIFFPKLGPIYVSGKTFGEVKSLLRGRLGAFAEVQSDISIGQVKGFQVSVMGEVQAPGMYQVSSFNTLLQAVSTAGGIRDIGSFRRVQVKRGKETVQEVDLYDFLLRGDTTHDALLRAADSVFVPVAGPLVAVAGEVRRQAIYELKHEKTIADVLEMAGGIAPSAYKRRVQVERLEGNLARMVVDLNLEEVSASLPSFTLQDGDILRILAVLPKDENAVRVEGNVHRPGKYQWKQGLTVGTLVPDETFFLPDTFLEYAMITRVSGPEKRREAIPVNLRRIVIEKDPSADVPLQPEDTLTVFTRSAFRDKLKATARGEVRNPGEFEILPGMRVSDLVKLAGDLTRKASLGEAELSRMDEKKAVTIRKIDLGKALAGDAAEDLLLQDQDYLLVRPVPNLQEVRYITLLGEVRSPGIYVVRKGERLSSLVERAGGFTEDAYLKAAQFTRISTQKAQQEAIDRLIEDLELEVAQKAQQVTAVLDKEDVEANKELLNARRSLIAQLRKAKAKGRVIIRLTDFETLRGTSADILLENGDRLEIPKKQNVVNVVGRVYNPTGVVYDPVNDRLGYYLKTVGGPTESADRDHIFMVKADGSVITRENADMGFFVFGEKNLMSARVEPGDSIVVPERLIQTRLMKDVKDITQILYQIAVTAGVLIVAF